MDASRRLDVIEVVYVSHTAVHPRGSYWFHALASPDQRRAVALCKRTCSPRAGEMRNQHLDHLVPRTEKGATQKVEQCALDLMHCNSGKI
jgi:5-methylcytosine-specific restriction endonuclease McrA